MSHYSEQRDYDKNITSVAKIPKARSSIDDATPDEWNAVAMNMMNMNNINIDLPTDYTLSTLSYSSDVSFVSDAVEYKFNEGKYLGELTDYVNSTYAQHYSQNKFQSTEVIIDRGHGTGFCMGNVDKYSNRYGKKGTPADARKDLMKILHYALLQLHVHDMENPVEKP